MEIEYKNNKSFLISFKDIKIILNADSQKQLNADILLKTYPNEVSGWGSVSLNESSDTLFIDGAGEFEKKGLQVIAIETRATMQKKDLRTTSYLLLKDNIKIILLGDISNKKDFNAIFDVVEEVDAVLYIAGNDSESKIKQEDMFSFVSKIGANLFIIGGDNKNREQEMLKNKKDINEVSGKFTLNSKTLPNKLKIVFFK